MVTIRNVLDHSVSTIFGIVQLYCLHTINGNDEAATDQGAYKQQLHSSNWFFKNWHYVLPEDGTHVPKHVGEVHLMFVLIKDVHLVGVINEIRRSQWPRGLRRRSTAARPLRLWVRIPPRAWTFVCCECCVLSARGLCDGLIIRSEESYRLWRVVVFDHETSQARRLKPARGL